MVSNQSVTWELHLQIKESCLTTLFHASLNLKISCKKTVQCTLILTFKETENFCMKKNDKWPIQILQLNFWIWQKNNKENEVINHQNFLARTNDRNFSTIIKKESNYFWWNLSLKTDLTNQNVCLASSFMSVRPLVCDLPILRQQNDWVIGVGKWPFLLTFSMYRIVRGWVQKSPKMCWRIIWVVPMRTNLSIRRRDVASSRHNKSPCFLAAA